MTNANIKQNKYNLLQNAAKMMYGENTPLLALYEPIFAYFFFHFVSAISFHHFCIIGCQH